MMPILYRRFPDEEAECGTRRGSRWCHLPAAHDGPCGLDLSVVEGRPRYKDSAYYSRPAEEIAARAGAAKPSPLATLRAEIDRLIAADSGPFAHARAAALRSLSELRPNCMPFVKPAFAMAYLRTYEERRGGARTPRADVRDAAERAVGERALATYERERCRSDVQARRGCR